MKNWKNIQKDSALRKSLLTRQKVVTAIRDFFTQEGFLEVETPLLVRSPGTEPYLEVFETVLRAPNTTDQQAFLLTSPELYMKKLLAAGLGSIFQICKSFRNMEGASSFHNPEFTILEWYRTPAAYIEVMQDCEKLLLYILQKVHNTTDTVLKYQGKQYELQAPWERISVAEAFAKYAAVTTDELLDERALRARAAQKGYAVSEETTWEEAYNQILLNEIEPHLGVDRPTILYDYPASQAALSRKKPTDPRFAERFEFFIGGIELGNAFTELTDAAEQKTRMEHDLLVRKQLGKTEYVLDEDFIDALEAGLPQTGGIAVGVDRLVMLFADAASIQETLFFPSDQLFT